MNNLDGPQKHILIKFSALQGYPHMSHCIYDVKVAYVVFLLKVLLRYFAVNVVHIYDISNLIFVHSNCIERIYRNFGGLLV